MKVPTTRNRFGGLTLSGAEHWETSKMIDIERTQSDDGSVRNTGMAAVALIAVGLSVMVWENHQAANEPASSTMLSVLNAP